MVVRVLFSALLFVTLAADVHIGIHYSPYSTDGAISEGGKQQLAAMLMAINEINDKNDGIKDDVLAGTTLRVAVQAVPNTFFGASVGSHYLSSEAFGGTGVSAVVGPHSLSLTKGITTSSYHFSSRIYCCRQLLRPSGTWNSSITLLRW